MNQETLIDVGEVKNAEGMSYISFKELVKEVTGVPFEEVYKEYVGQRGGDE